MAICNTFRDNSHLLILSRWVISYGSETSPCESSCKSRWIIYLIKIGYLQYFYEIIHMYSFWVGEQISTGLKLHHVKVLPKVDEWVIWEKLAICNTFRDNLHLLILSRWVISYGSETSPCESSSKSRRMNYLRKIGYLQYF